MQITFSLIFCSVSLSSFCLYFLLAREAANFRISFPLVLVFWKYVNSFDGFVPAPSFSAFGRCYLPSRQSVLLFCGQICVLILVFLVCGFFHFPFLLLPVELDCRLKQGYNSPPGLSGSSCHSSSSGGHYFVFYFTFSPFLSTWVF